MALLTILDSCVDLSGLPRWLSGKESACQYRRLKRHRFNPWVRKIPWRRKWQSTPAFLPGKSRGQWSLAVYSPWSHKRVKHSLAAKQQQQQIYTFSGQHITKEIHDQPPTPTPHFHSSKEVLVPLSMVNVLEIPWHLSVLLPGGSLAFKSLPKGSFFLDPSLNSLWGHN